MPSRIDLQRYKKTYPFIRREPRSYYLTERPMKIEIAQAAFLGSDEITYTFTAGFTSTPKITVTPVGSSANFSVFVSAASKNSVTIKASIPNSFSVDIHAIEVL